METEKFAESAIAIMTQDPLIHSHLFTLPTLVSDTGSKASEKFLEFFLATIRNANTRQAYAVALSQCLSWLQGRGVAHLHAVTPLMIAAYIEQHPGAAPTVQQHLAAIRRCFDYLVTTQVLPGNPAASVKGPRYSVTVGKTPVLSAADTRLLLDSIHPESWTGLRDRALIAVMVYSFARVSAVLQMRVEDYYWQARRPWLRLHEKGGKLHCVPAHPQVEAYLEAYLALSEGSEVKAWLFRTRTGKALGRDQVLRMIRRRA